MATRHIDSLQLSLWDAIGMDDPNSNDASLTMETEESNDGSQRHSEYQPGTSEGSTLSESLGEGSDTSTEIRPSETKTLEKDDLLMKTLLERTQTCWLALKNARQSGMTMQEAQELAFPIILLPDERDESVPQQ